MRGLPLVFVTALSVGSLLAQTSERMLVERVVIDAYVVDLSGEPLRGLAPSDFRLRIDGKAAPIEAVDWIGTAGEGSEPALSPALPGAESGQPERGVARPGRLIVLLFQTDFGRANQRIVGQMAMIHYSQVFLETLGPADRVAVLQFDSHLKLLQDFTDDLEAVRGAIRESLYIDNDSEWRLGGRPPIGITEKAARQAATPEQALALIGEGLRGFPGVKNLVFFSWGVGERTRGGVSMTYDYPRAMTALEKSRTAVFALDMGGPPSHTLAAGLMRVASDTGGFYISTHFFPKFAIEKLERTISGHYEIVFPRQVSTGGTHRIDLDLRGRRGTVYTRTEFTDGDEDEVRRR